MIVNLFSGPRNISTALMYSFAQRPDTKVIDEPLYGYYLKQTGADHPGREEVLGQMDTDPIKILTNMIQFDKEQSLIFIKNMCHHFIDLPVTFLLPLKNIFLIRDPVDMLPSLCVQIPNPTLRDTALKHQWTLFTQLEELGQRPLIIDARTLLNDPVRILKHLCLSLNIPFFDSMLAWDKGPRPEDGIWAKYWYQKVHDSTGFSPYEEKQEPFPSYLIEVLNECKPYYKSLLQYAVD
jgi:hypothetical protein